MELPRIAFNFNRKDYGRLRQMIDVLNTVGETEGWRVEVLRAHSRGARPRGVRHAKGHRIPTLVPNPDSCVLALWRSASG